MGKIKETKEGWNMDIFDFLTMLGGLSLFLFGMSLMGSALERRAGSRLRSLLDQMTGKPLVGFLTGLGVTAIIQSSSATTVMVGGSILLIRWYISCKKAKSAVKNRSIIFGTIASTPSSSVITLASTTMVR